MNKAEMADRLAARTGLSKAVCQGSGGRCVRGHRRRSCQWRGSADCGIRELRHQKQTGPYRTGRNPRTGEPVSVSASTSPTFKAGKMLKDTVNTGPRR